MKKTGIFFIAIAALTLVACSSEKTTDENEEVVAVTYSLDKSNSSFNWKGGYGPDYFHTGTIDFSNGSLTFEGDQLKEGQFTVDMNSIENTDLIEEPEKAESLVRHLKGLDNTERHKPEHFFNITKYPTVEVSLGDYKDGKLSLTLSILGKKLKQEVAVELTNDKTSASIKGAFSLDLTSLKIPGLQPNPEDGSGINPNIEFDLDITLSKS